MLQAKERARNASQRPETQQDDSPDRYAENRIEQTSEEIAHKAVEGGKNTVRKAKGWDKSIAITAYAETREQSRLIDEYIRNSNTKIKRIIHTK